MPLQVDPKDQQYIKSVLKQHCPNAVFYVFGSRATQTASKYSDIDILIKAEEAIPLSTLAKIDELFSASDLLFKVELVDWHRIGTEFQEHIMANCQAL